MGERVTLPGKIPDLLQPSSPVQIRGPAAQCSGVVGMVFPPTLYGVYAGGHNGTDRWMQGAAQLWNVVHLSLDLSEPTGQAHAAWWAGERLSTVELMRDDKLRSLLQGAAFGELDEAEQHKLRDLVLELHREEREHEPVPEAVPPLNQPSCGSLPPDRYTPTKN